MPPQPPFAYSRGMANANTNQSDFPIASGVTKAHSHVAAKVADGGPAYGNQEPGEIDEMILAATRKLQHKYNKANLENMISVCNWAITNMPKAFTEWNASGFSQVMKDETMSALIIIRDAYQTARDNGPAS